MRRGIAEESWWRCMVGEKEKEALNLVRMSLPRREMGHIGIIKKE